MSRLTVAQLYRIALGCAAVAVVVDIWVAVVIVVALAR